MTTATLTPIPTPSTTIDPYLYSSPQDAYEAGFSDAIEAQKPASTGHMDYTRGYLAGTKQVLENQKRDLDRLLSDADRFFNFEGEF